MKHLLFITMVLQLSLFIPKAFCQENISSLSQRFSLEAGSGYHLPFSPNKDLSTNDYAGFIGFEVGVHYAITDLWGLRITYDNNTFIDKKDKAKKLTIQKIMAEATFKILQSIQSKQNPFEVVAHTGIGVSAGKGPLLSDIDKMGDFQFGLMPLYHITRNFSLFLDATQVFSFRQNQGYNGQYVYEEIKDVTGSYLLINMGLIVNFDF